MPVAYPSTLPLAMLDKTREQPAAFTISEPRRGWGYVEPTGTDTPVFWPLVWRFNGTQAQTFRQWFVFTISRGVDTFEMPIRTEFGLETLECQFLPDGLLPARQIGFDVWEYRATVMARALAVGDSCVTLTEAFASDLTGYALVNGATTPFTATGGVATIAASTGVENTIKRVWGDAISVRQIVFEWKATAVNSDDNGTALVASVDSGGESITVIPARESGSDALRRPLLHWGTSELLLGVRQVTVNKWYRATLLLIGTDVRYQIVNLDDATLFAQGMAGFNVGAVVSNAYYLAADATGTSTGSTEVRKIQPSSCEPTTPAFSAWNPSDKDADVSLNYLNALAAITAPAQGAARGTQGRDASGDWYFEVSNDSSGGSATDGRVMIGIGGASATVASYPGASANSWGYLGQAAQLWNNAGSTSYGATFTTETIGVRINAGTLTFYKNGVSQGVAATGITGTVYPMWGTPTGTAGSRWGTLNTGGWDFVALPSGSTAWG